jgi:hypothetical protein
MYYIILLYIILNIIKIIISFVVLCGCGTLSFSDGETLAAGV